MTSTPTQNLKAILFDMDGTLTTPNIDWKQLRQAVGVPEGTGIMEHIYSLSAEAAHQADLIVRDIEMTSVRTADPNEGLTELFDLLRTTSLKLALITNNHRQAMEHVVERFSLRFDLLLSREDALLKPAPDLLNLALDHFAVSADQAVFVGDGRYDREASAAAGVRYIHLQHGPDQPAEGEIIHSLADLPRCLGLASA